MWNILLSFLRKYSSSYIGSTHGLTSSNLKPPLEYTPRTNAIFSIIVTRTQLLKPDILAYNKPYYAGHAFVEKSRPVS